MHAMQTMLCDDPYKDVPCKQYEWIIKFITISKPHLDKMREMMQADYGVIIKETLKHYEFLEAHEVDIQSYIDRLPRSIKEFHDCAESLECYLGFLKKDVQLFEDAEQWFNEPTHESVQEDRLLRFLEILTDHTFKNGHKEFELLTFFNLSD
jgi:hypothetical protein